MTGSLTRFVVCMTLVCMMMIFGFRTLKVNAAKNIRSNERKYFTSYTVEKDDTLVEIAQMFMTPEYRSTREYVNEIVKSNHLDSTAIEAGQLLIIPYYADAPMEL